MSTQGPQMSRNVSPAVFISIIMVRFCSSMYSLHDNNSSVVAVQCCCRMGPAYSWWHHQMETFSALLALCVGNSPETGEFPTQRPATRSFDVFFDLRLSKRPWGWWFGTPSWSSWRHCNVIEIHLNWETHQWWCCMLVNNRTWFNFNPYMDKWLHVL